MANTQRTQAERRAESRRAVLDSACQLFGKQGYSATSLEQIADDCGLTIRPIYHYFGSKKELFKAVNKVMEQRILDAMEQSVPSSGMSQVRARWRMHMDLCEDPGFRQIVLIDSPNVLGRERWHSSAVTLRAQKLMASSDASVEGSEAIELYSRVIMAAFAEAALFVAESDDFETARAQAEQLVERLFKELPGF